MASQFQEYLVYLLPYYTSFNFFLVIYIYLLLIYMLTHMYRHSRWNTFRSHHWTSQATLEEFVDIL